MNVVETKRWLSSPVTIGLWVAGAWTFLVAVIVGLLLFTAQREILEVALNQARATFQKDTIYRYWVADRGGVYVERNEKTPANPYLENIPDRDVTTTSGKQLTLVNPAYMTRMVHELGKKEYGIYGHITSLKPIRPENAADAWETRALTKVEQGLKEVWETLPSSAGRELRYLAPLVTQERCLKCHANQGYKVGDIRGGISVTVPLKENWMIKPRFLDSVAVVILGGLWILGLTGIGIGTYVSNRRHREKESAAAALHKREQQYLTMLQSSMDGFWVLDMQGKILDVNDTYCRMSGYSRQELLNLTVLDLEANETRENNQDHILKVTQQGYDRFESKHRRKDHNIMEVEVSVKYEMHDGGRMYVFLRDITDSRLLESQLRQAQKMEAIGQLAGGVAHDFNNILASFLLQLGLIRTDPATPSNLQEPLAELEKEARRATNLTRQLLTFSRRQVIQIKPLQLNDLIADLLSMLRRLLGEHIELVVRAAAKPVWIEGDAGMMEQVVVNLCVNARDAMANGGKLTIATQLEELSQERSRPHPDSRAGRFVRLTVIDTGCGMDKTTLQKIFTPFFTTKEVGKGTGLGLATVYGIVKQHHGWIEVTSEPGAGANFSVYIPALEKVPEERSVTQAEPVRRGTEHILLVEDDTSLRKTTALCLRRYGYSVAEAANGVEALIIWEQQAKHFDLLVTDMIMPKGLSGLDLASQLCKDKPGLKVLIATGYTAEVKRVSASPEVRFRLLAKPYLVSELTHSVRQLLDGE